MAGDMRIYCGGGGGGDVFKVFWSVSVIGFQL